MNCKTYHTKSGKSIRLWQGDCMDLMETGQWDLAIVDPPYGMPERSGRGAGKLQDRKIQGMHQNGWDIKPDKFYFQMLFETSYNQIIWGGNYFLDYLGSTRGFIIWDKEQPFENFSDCEMAWTSFDTIARIYKQRATTAYTNKIHPTEKPIRLYRWLLKNYATENDTILDTHGGSMSLAIACYIEDFELNIIELDEDYYNSAVKRFEQHISQKTLF